MRFEISLFEQVEDFLPVWASNRLIESDALFGNLFDLNTTSECSGLASTAREQARNRAVLNTLLSKPLSS